MTRSILVLAVTVVLLGCGVEDSAPVGPDVDLAPPADFDSLRPPPSHAGVLDPAQPLLDPAVMGLPLVEAQPQPLGEAQIRQTPGCARQVLTPVVAGTLRQIPGLGIFEPAPVGSSVQASYFNTTGVNEEFRVGIAEFEPGPNVVTATLRFTERRAVLTAPTSDDRFALTLYPADLQLTLQDWKVDGEDSGTFTTNMNDAPAQLVELDLTKFVQAAGKRVGLRFELVTKGISGHGTGFDDLTLDVVSCDPDVR